MEADLLDFPELQDAQSLKKRLAESYTCSIRRASTPANEGSEWVDAALGLRDARERRCSPRLRDKNTSC